MPIELKEEYYGEIVAYGNSGKPLGERNDLHILARLGKERNGQLLKYFKEVPTDEELDKADEDYFEYLQDIKKSKELEYAAMQEQVELEKLKPKY